MRFNNMEEVYLKIAEIALRNSDEAPLRESVGAGELFISKSSDGMLIYATTREEVYKELGIENDYPELIRLNKDTGRLEHANFEEIDEGNEDEFISVEELEIYALSEDKSKILITTVGDIIYNNVDIMMEDDGNKMIARYGSSVINLVY